MRKSIREQIEQLLNIENIAIKQASFWKSAHDVLLAQTEAAKHGESPVFKEHFVDVLKPIDDDVEGYIRRLPVILTALSDAQILLMSENNRQLIDLMQDLITEKTK